MSNDTWQIPGYIYLKYSKLFLYDVHETQSSGNPCARTCFGRVVFLESRQQRRLVGADLLEETS